MKLGRTPLLLFQILMVLGLVCCSGCCSSYPCVSDKIRSDFVALGKRSFKTVDWKANYFRVMQCSPSAEGVTRANVPTDAIEYGLFQIVGVDKDYPYVNRIIAAVRKGLQECGCVRLYYIYKAGTGAALIAYNNDSRHLLVRFNGESGNSYAASFAFPEGSDIDLSEVDVSVK